MIGPNVVSAVLVTRGDQDLQEIYDSIERAGVTDVVTWNNAEREDVKCYGRYAAIPEAKNEFIYFQDDDLVAPVGELLAAWRPEDRLSILANNRIDEEWPLLGIGSLFHRDLVDVLEAYVDEYVTTDQEREEFCRICDVVFGYENPYRRVVLGYYDLPWGSAPGASMYLEPNHMAVRLRARERTFALQRKVYA